MNVNPTVKIILLGNKSDMEQERKVPTEAGEQYFKKNHLHFFKETSASTGFNVKEIFIEAAKLLMTDWESTVTENTNVDYSNASICIDNEKTYCKSKSSKKTRDCNC